MKALGGVLSDEGTVSKSKATLVDFLSKVSLHWLIPLMMVLDPVKPVLRLRAVTLLPESSDIEIG